jgi:hypothetical protein
VVTSLTIRFGIFASGTSGTREKVVRIRYYLEGSIWNPYNRVLGMHGAESLQPAFTLVWQGLPKLRIRNLSKGMVTAWISLDEVFNTRTGARGMSGWIRTPGILRPGEVYAFSEPDQKYQPEGLARTIHPSFSVGPADRVILEFSHTGTAATAACLVLDESKPIEAAETGRYWFAFRGVPIELPEIELSRADQLPAPFYLHGGSLDFRKKNCQYQIQFMRPHSTFQLPTDPRRKQLSFDASHLNASGEPIEEKHLFEVTSDIIGSDRFDTVGTSSITPLFSWPNQEPVSIIGYTDYTGWNQSYRLGSAGANSINALLDDPGILPTGEPASPFSLLTASGNIQSYQQTFPLNHTSPDGWTQLIRLSIDDTIDGFHSYPTTSGDRLEDFNSTTVSELSQLGNHITFAIRTAPSASVSDFFNRGLLASPQATTLDSLLPLRGYLRSSRKIRPHGSSWILHLSISISEDQIAINRQARAWLQETLDDTGQPQFNLIHFEWVQTGNSK